MGHGSIVPGTLETCPTMIMRQLMIPRVAEPNHAHTLFCSGRMTWEGYILPLCLLPDASCIRCTEEGKCPCSNAFW